MNTTTDTDARKNQTKADYIAAIQELFSLLAVPADQRTEDHRARLMAANNECGRTRLIMIEVWEGESIA